MNAEFIAKSLGKCSPKSGGGWMACCPSHDDKNPSLSISDKNGKILVKCFAGCRQDAVVAALKQKSLWPDNQPGQTAEPIKQRVVGRYDYHGPDGNILYWKERVEPGKKGKKKEFFFYHGNRLKGRGGESVLYHLPDVVKAKAVLFTEGEQQADLLKSWELAATTLDSGSSSMPTAEQVEQLTGKRVAILRDNDAAGFTYANTIAAALCGKVESLKIILLPGLPEKGDVIDWAQEPGNDKARLLEIIKASPEWTQATETVAVPTRVCAVEVADFMAHEFPPRENILAPWLPQQGLAMVYAPRGVGKTHFSLSVAYAVACGGSFFSWKAPSPRGVLFIDGEMPGSVLQERLARIVMSNEKEAAAPLRIITPDLQKNGMIDLTQAEDQAELVPHLEGVSLIVVDNLSTLCRSGKENEGEGWLPVQEWALMQRAAGRSVLFVHHAGKNGEQRGTSRREDVLDTVIALRRPRGYSPDKGACFEVHFEKARGIMGDDTKPFEAQLIMTPDRKQEWATKSLEQSTAEKVAALLNEGIPQAEIAEMLGIHKGTVSKAKKRAHDSGLLKSAEQTSG